MSARAPEAQLRSQVRTMAILCVALGPILIAMSLAGLAVQRLLRHAEAQGLTIDAPLGVLNVAALDFAVRSIAVSVPLGVALIAFGALALRSFERAPSLLALAAWITVAGMLGLSVLWSVTVSRTGLGLLGHLSGWLTHGAQGALAAVTARWLTRDDVRAACARPAA